MTPMKLLETMRLEAGAVALLDLHLARLARSAAHFGYAFAENEGRRAVVAAGASVAADAHRLRLTLDGRGRVATSAEPVARLAPIRTVALCPASPEIAGPYGRHKTTERALYAPALAQANAAGADEALLVDADGLLVEATRANVWVKRGGRLLTPDLERTGLPGVMRAHLLATRPEARAASLPAASLLPGDVLLLSNAVRGLWRVRLVGTPPGSASFDLPFIHARP